MHQLLLLIILIAAITLGCFLGKVSKKLLLIPLFTSNGMILAGAALLAATLAANIRLWRPGFAEPIAVFFGAIGAAASACIAFRALLMLKRKGGRT